MWLIGPVARAMRSMPQAAYVKLVQRDAASESGARNLGVGAAAGEIIAFKEDCSVPEPTWLTFLIAPFADADTAAASGYIRGRDGVFWRHRGGSVDLTGQVDPVEPERGLVTIYSPSETGTIKT